VSKIINDARAALSAFRNHDLEQGVCIACGSVDYERGEDGECGPRMHFRDCPLKLMADSLQALIDTFE
jgi:hypothetical protein